MAEIFVTATEYRRMAITVNSGTIGDVTGVGVAFGTDPNDPPDPGLAPAFGAFTQVTLDGSDILVKIGPDGGDVNPAAGTHQVFTLIRTANESIIDLPDTLDVIGPTP